MFEVPNHISSHDVLNNLRFGFGALLKNGEGDTDESKHPEGKTLKGRYIVRVGWDDVRGWMGEVSHWLHERDTLLTLTGRNRDWYCAIDDVSYCRGKNGSCA
jgi:hypothetical protein